jgi:hypothetical protein
MLRFFFAVVFFVPVVSMAEELSGLPVAKEVFEPFCELYVERSAAHALQDEGYLSKGEVDNSSFIAKIIGFKKIGIVSVEPEITEDPDNILYQIIIYIKFQGKNEKAYEVVAIDEVSTRECGMTARPLVILTSPEYRILGTWEGWLQAEERHRQTPKGKYSYPTPNLIK